MIGRKIIALFRDTISPVTLEPGDYLLISIFAVISIISRFSYFSYPEQQKKIRPMSFSECYYEEYHKNHQPPLTTFLNSIFIYMSNKQSDSGLEHNSTITLRLCFVLISTFTSPLVYTAMRFSFFSKIAAFISASFIILETSLLYQDRTSLSQGFSHFILSLFLCIIMYSFTKQRYSQVWYFLTRVLGVIFGLAISIRRSFFSLFSIYAFNEFIFVLMENGAKFNWMFLRKLFRNFLTFLIPTFIISAFIWSIHYPIIYKKNYYLRKNHQGRSSNPKHWPLMTGFLRLPIDRFGRFLYIGNILIHYLSFIGVIITLLFTFKRRYFKGMKLVICYVLNYVPYFYVRYVVSSSDYDTALIVAIMCFGVALDYVGWGTLRGFLMVIALTIAVIGFLIWAPIVYNVPLTEAEYRRKVWSLSW